MTISGRYPGLGVPQANPKTNNTPDPILHIARPVEILVEMEYKPTMVPSVFVRLRPQRSLHP